MNWVNDAMRIWIFHLFILFFHCECTRKKTKNFDRCVCISLTRPNKEIISCNASKSNYILLPFEWLNGFVCPIACRLHERNFISHIKNEMIWHETNERMNICTFQMSCQHEENEAWQPKDHVPCTYILFSKANNDKLTGSKWVDYLCGTTMSHFDHPIPSDFWAEYPRLAHEPVWDL